MKPKINPTIPSINFKNLNPKNSINNPNNEPAISYVNDLLKMKSAIMFEM